MIKSSLIIRTSSKIDISLRGVVNIITIPSVFSIHPKQNYIYLYNDNAIDIKTVAPLLTVDTISYKKDIKDMLIIDNTLYILNEQSIISHGGKNERFNSLNGNFENSRLIDICNGNIGVQKTNELEIYSPRFVKLMSHRCQCSFAMRGCLILGDFNNLKVFIKDELQFQVAMPDNISCIIADPIFSKIFCATIDNNIYRISLNGQNLIKLGSLADNKIATDDILTKMDYHSEPVKFMKLSFCGEYLYTADTKMVCVWGTKHCVAMGVSVLDADIEGLGIILDGNRTYSAPPIDI